MQNHYVENLETGKLELHFSKADYKALPHDVRDKVRRYFSFSRRSSAWISKAKAPNLHYVKTIAEEAGLEDGGTEGEQLSFEEQQEEKRRKAERRAERLEDRADRLSKKAKAEHEQASKMASVIPLGQPILVGHHSEKRDRRYRDKIHNKFGKAFELHDKAKDAERRAKAAERTANAAELENPAYLQRRIDEAQAEIRKYDRRLEDIEAGKYPGAPDYDERVERLKAEATERLHYYANALEECGGITYDRDTIKAEDPEFIKYRGKWYPVKRINQKTVTVSYWLDVESMTWKVPYAEIQEVSKPNPDG